MSEFDIATVAHPPEPRKSAAPLKPRRSGPDLLWAASAFAVIGSAFLPWIVIRLPNRDSETFSLVEMTGGRLFTGLAASSCVIGFVLQWRLPSLGKALMMTGASLVGWLAGIGLLALGLLRGLLPSLTVLGIDFSQSLLGTSYGVLLAFAGVNLAGIRLVARARTTQRLYSRTSVVLLTMSLLLFVLHQSVWVVADLGDVTGRIIITGDSLFGALLTTLAVWIAVVLASLGFILNHQTFVRLAAIALLFASLVKLLQTIVIWTGRGLLRLLLPSRVESATNFDIRWTVYASAVLAITSVGLAIFVIVVGDKPVGRLSVQHLLPGLAAVHAFAVVALVLLNLFPSNSGVQVSSIGSQPASTTTLAMPSPPTSISPATTLTTVAGVITPANVLLGSVVNITLGRPGSECSGGSGVIIGDGTYVLTNEHVVTPKQGDPISCEAPFVGITTSPTEPPTQIFEAEVLIADPVRDLALLRILGVASGSLPTLSPRYDVLPIDAAVRLIGYPGVGGETVTQTRGQVAGYLDDRGGRLYKVDIVSNRGNSGGPLVDESGNLVGILTFGTGNPVDCNAGTCESIGANLALVRTISAAKDLIEQARAK